MPKPPALRGIYLRKTSYWLALQRAGERRFFNLETLDLATAIARAEEIRGSEVAPDGESLPALARRYVAHMRDTGEWTASSHEAKRYVLAAWAADMPARPSEITTELIARWHAARLKSVSAATAHGNLMLLRGFFRWLVNERHCATNPLLALTDKKSPRRVKPPAPSARKDFCPPDLRDKLITEAPHDDLRFILYCGFHAGLRKQEIVEARAFWFDLSARILHLRKHDGIQFKDREERSIPLSTPFALFMHRYGLREPYVLRPDVPKGKSLYRYDFDRPFRDYMAAQGCPWVTPHVMRHTFASLLATAGVSIYSISEWLGDGVAVVQRHYARLIPQHKQIDDALLHRVKPPTSSAMRNRTGRGTSLPSTANSTTHTQGFASHDSEP